MQSTPFDARGLSPGEFFDRMGVPYTLDGRQITVEDVDLTCRGLTHLPDLQDVVVKGSFDCSQNLLVTLDGAPRRVGSDFDCDHNRLRSLEGGPESVGNSYDCSYNQLSSLKGSPKTVGHSFFSNSNSLLSLNGCAAMEVGNYFKVSDNLINDFSIIPKRFQTISLTLLEKSAMHKKEIINGRTYSYKSFLEERAKQTELKEHICLVKLRLQEAQREASPRSFQGRSSKEQPERGGR